MPGMDGVELIHALKARRCLMPVIVITGHADVTVAVQAMKAGAAEFVQKPFESELILRLVRACLEENDDAVDASSRRLRVLRRIESLTAREHQVLDLIMEGASNKLIASSLDISPRTVEIYRANVMSKMRADSLSDLIRMTLSAGAA
jgi:two-component system response regulator FixJ